MTAVALHQSRFSLKSASNCPIVLLPQIDCMRSLTRVLERFFALRPSFVTRLSVWRKQGTKLGSKIIVAASEIVSTMQASLRSKSSICHELFNLIARGHTHTAKLRSPSFFGVVISQWPSVDKGLIEFFFADTTRREEKKK